MNEKVYIGQVVAEERWAWVIYCLIPLYFQENDKAELCGSYLLNTVYYI